MSSLDGDTSKVRGVGSGRGGRRPGRPSGRPRGRPRGHGPGRPRSQSRGKSRDDGSFESIDSHQPEVARNAIPVTLTRRKGAGRKPLLGKKLSPASKERRSYWKKQGFPDINPLTRGRGAATHFKRVCDMTATELIEAGFKGGKSTEILLIYNTSYCYSLSMSCVYYALSNLCLFIFSS